MKYLLFLLILITLPVQAEHASNTQFENSYDTLYPKAIKGDALSQFQLGEMYQYGRGVNKNAKNAFNWYLKSAKQNHKQSAFEVGIFYWTGYGVAANAVRAKNWLTLSSNEGYSRADFYLGEMYELGNGVEKDLLNALKWYQKAEQGGYNLAAQRIERVNKALSPNNRPFTTRKPVTIVSKKVTVKKANIKPVSMKASPSSTQQLLLEGGWMKSKKPSAYLPSTITDCVARGKTIECMSQPQKRNIGMADIKYVTKAVLFSLKSSGKFKISYRNNVLGINVTNPDFASSRRKLPVKKGWQDAEHSLTCTFVTKKKLDCKKDKIRTIKFHR